LDQLIVEGLRKPFSVVRSGAGPRHPLVFNVLFRPIRLYEIYDVRHLPGHRLFLEVLVAVGHEPVVNASLATREALRAISSEQPAAKRSMAELDARQQAEQGQTRPLWHRANRAHGRTVGRTGGSSSAQPSCGKLLYLSTPLCLRPGLRMRDYVDSSEAPGGVRLYSRRSSRRHRSSM
jgi:hypothetical protein